MGNSRKLWLRNTCSMGQVDGVAGAVEHGCHERSHCSITPAKFASFSQDACTGAGPRAQPKEVPGDVRDVVVSDMADYCC